ncbi:MAG: hypothetical protein MUC47_08735 [Candidatus Kapabacteria bacterium]|jgi:outer membrane lipoprotein-sorting protein|nr:hypothetical protein [Candidatus Kapabacteria bacterium]
MIAKNIVSTSSVLGGILCLASTGVFAKEDIAQRFHTTYRSLKSIECTFTREGTINGSLIAIKGKGYDIRVGDRRIVSDGVLIWNITEGTKTVVINKVQSNSQDLSIEQMFFTMMSIYVPSVVKESGAVTTLRLLPPSPQAIVGGVEQADVSIDRSLKVKRIETRDGGQTSIWTVTSMKLNRVGATSFSYKPLSGWNVVDLR